ncbi:SET binding factor 2 [Pelomyxa schiedti]|nr:SET binding factor 2 [Pelomyxa schiedti]
MEGKRGARVTALPNRLVDYFVIVSIARPAKIHKEWEENFPNIAFPPQPLPAKDLLDLPQPPSATGTSTPPPTSPRPVAGGFATDSASVGGNFAPTGPGPAPSACDTAHSDFEAAKRGSYYTSTPSLPSVTLPPKRQVWETRFEGTMAVRVPKTDYKDAKVTECLQSIWMFCFPNGLKLEKTEPAPQFTTFVMTNVEGKRSYVYGLISYQQCQSCNLDLPPDFSDDSSQQEVYVPICMCLFSHYSFLPFFKDCLKELYRASLPASPASMEATLERILYDVPLPLPEMLIQVPMPTKTLELCKSSKCFFDNVDMDLKLLFDLIGIETVVDLLSWVLVESHILFVSSRRSVLTIASGTIMTLIYPFQWCHTYIPILPLSVREYWHAPTPYIMGLMRDCNEPVPNIPEVITIDLDTGEVLNKIPSILPSAIRSALIGRLKDIFTLHPMDVLDIAFYEEDPTTAVPHPAPSINTRIQCAFMLVFLPILQYYRQCYQIARKYPSPVLNFETAKFLQHQDPLNRDFAKLLHDSTFFPQFYRQFYLESENIFDLSVFRYSQGDYELAFLTSGIFHSKISETYVVPPMLPISHEDSASFHTLSDTFQNKNRTPVVLEALKKNVELSYYNNDPKLPVFETGKTMSEWQEIINTVVSAKIPPKGIEDADYFSRLITLNETLTYTKTLTTFTFTKDPDCGLSEWAFSTLLDTCKNVISCSKEKMDFRPVAELIRIVSVYYHKVNNFLEFLYTPLASHDFFWKNNRFWEYALYCELRILRTSLPKHIQSTTNDWNSLSPEQQKASVQLEEESVFRAIIRLLNISLALGGQTVASQLISSMSGEMFLSNATTTKLEQYLQRRIDASTQSEAMKKDKGLSTSGGD